MTNPSLLAEIDELRIYTTHIEVGGRRKTFDEVQRVHGGSYNLSINLLSAVKHTSISVVFVGGDSYYMDEDRTIFGKERHRKIGQCVVVLQKLTFESRLKALVAALARYGTLLVGRESNETYTLLGALADKVSGSRTADVFLDKDGNISNRVLTLDLKRCRSDGILELGIVRANKNAPGQVYACYERSVFEKSKNRALKFDLAGEHDQDVVLALLDWLAKPSNRIGAQNESRG